MDRCTKSISYASDFLLDPAQFSTLTPTVIPPKLNHMLQVLTTAEYHGNSIEFSSHTFRAWEHLFFLPASQGHACQMNAVWVRASLTPKVSPLQLNIFPKPQHVELL